VSSAPASVGPRGSRLSLVLREKGTRRVEKGREEVETVYLVHGRHFIRQQGGCTMRLARLINTGTAL
jgi:hypothetical protein